MIGRFTTKCIYAALKRYDEENPRRILRRDEHVITIRTETQGIEEVEKRLDRLAWRAKQLRQEIQELEGPREKQPATVENG